ncbi:MAG: hypothetical protein ACRDPK_19965 [Carbonactinosporaceae bacterium]
MAAESLERPALVVTPQGMWRLYVSCATPGGAHWRVELMEARDPGGFDPARRQVVLPGDAKTAVKDPVIVHHDGLWHLWASCHPLTVVGETDQMTTDYATSLDGLAWTWHGTALDGRLGYWDGRGTRITSVMFSGSGVLASYDGRASALENCEERTGLAVGAEPGALAAHATAPAATSPYGSGCLRYLAVVALPGGSHRLYYKAGGLGGSHDLCTELLPASR